MSSTEYQDPSDRLHQHLSVFKQPSQIALVVGFCIVVFLFIVVGYFHISKKTARSASATNRLEQLEEVLPVAVFAKWFKCDQKKHPNWRRTEIDDQVCVICLDSIVAEDSIRALSCRHIYHAQCFDQWFRTSKHCPLCHRLIISANDAVV